MQLLRRLLRGKNLLPTNLILALALWTGLLSGCGNQAGWQGQVLPADFPTLEFQLQTAAGNITQADVQGQVSLLFFGYMSCPDVCPATLANLRLALHELPAAQRDQIRVLFVSVDPARDEPARLAAFAAHFGPEFIGATAAEAELRLLTRRYGSSFQATPDAGFYPVAHGSNLLLFDGSGRARLLMPHDQPVAALVHDLRKLLRDAV